MRPSGPQQNSNLTYLHISGDGGELPYLRVYTYIYMCMYSGGTYVPMHMGAKDGHEDRRVGRGVGRVREGERLLVPDKNPRIEVYLLCAKADRMTHTAYVARKKRREGYVCMRACVRARALNSVRASVCTGYPSFIGPGGGAAPRSSLLLCLSIVRKGCGSMSMD